MTKTNNEQAERTWEEVLRASVNYVPRDFSEEHRPVLRMMLARRMMSHMKAPLRCREPRCRRSKQCVGRSMRCRHDMAQPPMTEKENADAVADFRALVIARMRELGKL